MSDAKLWIDEVGCTVLVKNGSAIHILPLWVFESIRDIIVAEAEKKVEVTHRDFDTQQELLDRYRAENAKLRGLLEAVLQCAGEIKRDKGCDACPMYNETLRNDGTWCLLRSTLRELGVEV